MEYKGQNAAKFNVEIIILYEGRGKNEAFEKCAL
jgi:hypothetical protein